MRGGLTYEEALNLSWTEREIVSDLVKENLETTKENRTTTFLI
jgi:hypothetical protein